jgi:sugar phosphate isomerase/epimerase
MYQEAVDRIAKAGFCPTIENEVGGCILSRPDEVLAFFEALDRTAASFTWDVQNMWQMGSAPTLSVYKSLKDLIGYYHVKGGRAEVEERALCWSTALEDASWPVLDITRRVIVDGVSPVICLNASHGRQMPGYNYENVVERDIDFLREGIEEIA